MKQLEASSRYHIIEAMIHIIGWGIVFAFPFIMMTRSGFTISWQDYLHHGGIVPVTFLIVFYVNYFILIPHYLFKGRTKEYFILNILLILCTAIGVHFWQDYISVRFPRKEHDQDKPMAPPRWIFFLRDIFSMILTVGLSTAIRLSGRWGQIEAARR